MSKDSGIVNIHGKQYQTVAYRVGKFKEIYPNFSLTTEIVSRDEECVVMKATITDDAGRIRATGHSEEYRHTSQINRTSALENAETSAIGRALAALGMGGTEFASADEVANAIQQQKKGHSASDGAFDALGDEDQHRVKTIANGIVDYWGEGKELAAYELFYEGGLNNDQKIAIWELLRPHSKIRNGLKKMSDANKVKVAA
jgi:hypothetical protein